MMAIVLILATVELGYYLIKTIIHSDYLIKKSGCLKVDFNNKEDGKE